MARPKNLEDSTYKRTRRDEILAAAGGLFSTNGFASTTVRDIGEVVGMHSGSLYYYFPSKEAIADTLLRRYLDHVWQQYDDIAEDRESSAADRLIKVLQISLLSIDEYYHEVVLFQREGQSLARDAGFDYIGERRRGFRDLVVGVVTDGISSGDFRSDLNIGLTYSFIRDTVWPVASWYVPQSSTTITEIVAHYVRLVLTGIVADVSTLEDKLARIPTPSGTD